MRSIALFLPNWVGDVVMATPAIQAVANTFGRPAPRGLPTMSPRPSRRRRGSTTSCSLTRRARESREVAVIRRLRRSEHVDAAVLFPNSIRSAAVAAGSGRCRRRIGFDRYGRGLL